MTEHAFEISKKMAEAYENGMVTPVVLVNQGGRDYLFSVKDAVRLSPGERVACETRRGIQDGTCSSHTLMVDDYAMDVFCKLTGATLPLANVIGRYNIEKF